MVDRLVAVDDADYRLPAPVLAALGADLGDPGNPLGAELNTTIEDAAQSRNVKNFGAVADGVTPVGTSLASAIDATPAGGTLILSEGDYYVSSTGITITKDIHVAFRGARLIIGGGGGSSTLRFAGGYDTPQTVSSLSKVTIPAGDGGFGSASSGVQLTLSATAPVWKVGDVVKVYSNDYWRGQRGYEQVGWDPTGTSVVRLGQHMVVHSVSGSTVTLAGDLRDFDFYTTGIRVAKITDVKFRLSGLNTIDSGASPANRPTLLVKAFRNPVIDRPRIANSVGAAITIQSCDGATIEDPRIYLATDDDPAGIYGYGINVSGGNDVVVNGGSGQHLRHTFTTTESAIPVDAADPALYGVAYNVRVAGMKSRATASSAFDTHLGSDSVHFIGCDVESVGSGSAFNLRGVRHSVIGCTARNVNVGVSLSGEGSYGGLSYGHTIDGLSVDGVGTLLTYDINPLGSVNAGLRETRRSTFRNVNARNVSQRALHVVNGSLMVSNLSIQAFGAAATGSFLRTAEAGYISGSDVSIDLGSTALPETVFGVANTGGIIDLVDFEVSWTGTAPTGLINVVAGTGSRLSRGRISGVLSSIFPAGNLVSWALLGTSAAVPGHAALSNASVTTTELEKILADTEVATNVLRWTVTADRTLPTLPSGRRYGQRLLVWSSTTSTNPITITNGANTTLIGAADKVLTAGQKIELVWTNINWVQVAPVA